jgi:heme/copper-type cytochrome/quinol oxidase subunit 3
MILDNRLLTIFFPVGFVIWALVLGVEIPEDALNLIISVFAIVSALLFGALFSIFSVASSIDRSKLAREFSNMASFKRQLRSINRVVVYLVGLAALSVCVTLAFFLVDLSPKIEMVCLVFLITHFFSIFFPLIYKIFHFLELAYRKI